MGDVCTAVLKTLSCPPCAWHDALGSAVHKVMTNLKRANDAPPRRRPAGALRPGRLAFPAPMPAAAPARGELEITSK